MPDWTPHLREHLDRLKLDPAREAEIVEELSQHLDERYEELRGAGMEDAQARRLAIAELLEPEALAESMRPLRQAKVPPPITPGTPGGSLFGGLALDLRYSARMLRKQRSLAVAALLTLALGIGVNGAIFALVDATLLRPLPLPEPDRVVMIWDKTSSSDRESVSPLNLLDWNERSRTFAVIGGFIPNVGGMVMRGEDGNAETIPRQWVTANVFSALGVRPVAGRTFTPEDELEDVGSVVISESFWRARFHADPTVIGTVIHLDGDPWTIRGVVPEEAAMIGRSTIWAMINIGRAPPEARGEFFLHAIGRLEPGVTLEEAEAEMTAISGRLAEQFPDTNRERGVALEPMHQAVIGPDLRRTSILFLGVVGFVLLICCANVASLLLTRATARVREMAIRSALGADRRRIARQLLTESVLLSLIGGGIGLLFGAVILRIAPSMIPEELLPPGVILEMDLRVVAFCAGAALLAGLLFGLAPAWQATRLSPAQGIASSSRTVTGRGGGLRAVLVVAQVATAVMLLFGAGLFLRTLLAIENVDRGYRAETALTMVIDPLGSRYPTPALLLQFYESIEREVLSLPGVRAMAWATTLPFGPSYLGTASFQIDGAPPVEPSQRPTADLQVVSPSYFRTLELSIVAGRGFDARDSPDAPSVCMVNEAFVRRHFGGRNPVGSDLRIGDRRDSPCQIVGVARQVKGSANESEDFVQIYVPLAQFTPGDIYMIVRPEAGRAERLVPSVRAAISRVDVEQLVSVRDIMTLDEVAGMASARHRFRAIVVLAFAGLALLLAMVGLFGTLAYSVQQRVRDFGVRRALGASTIDVLRMVARSAFGLIAAGALLGLISATLLARLLASMLFGVRPLDATTFAVVTIVLVLTAAASAAGPAWRAARIDPVVALRDE